MIYLELWRRAQGLTQREAANKLGPGFSEASISMLESGRLKPSPKQQARLHELFGDDADALFERFTDTDLKMGGATLSSGRAS